MDIEEQYDKIYRYCYFKLHDCHLAQDITQETFLRFYRQELSLDNGRELPYLYTIAKNLCIDEFRKKPVGSIEGIGTESVDIESAGIEAARDQSEEWIDSMILRAAIEKLSQEEQELLFLRYVNEASVASICKITGISRFAVYRRLSKSLKWLKKEMIKEGFSE